MHVFLRRRSARGIMWVGSFLVAVAIAAAGCSPQGSVKKTPVVEQRAAVTTPPASAAPVQVVTASPPASRPPTEAKPGATPAAPAGLAEARVTRVVDGDTIEVENANKETLKVRLIGVDTPETVHPSKPVQPYGPEASAYTKQRLNGQSVQLEYDVERNDHYGRTLAYIWLGQELFNATLVKEGYGQLMTIPPNVKYVDQFRQIQTAAREAKRGMWGVGSQPADVAETPTAPAPVPAPAATPAPAPKPTPAPARAPAPAAAEAKSGRFAPSGGQCVENGAEQIKGNRNSMIFHPPTGQSYNKTVAEDCFYTAEDAVAAGYRAAKR